MPRNSQAVWSDQEIETLVQLHAKNASRDEMQHVLSRSRGSISSKLDRLGILSRPKRWVPEEIEVVVSMFKTGASYSEIGLAVGKTRGAVGGIIGRLRDRHELPALDVKQHKELQQKRQPFRIPTERVAPLDKAGRMEYKRLLNAGLVEARGARSTVSKEDNHTPPEMRKALLDLEPNTCRWPYGVSDFTFCARPADGSYCPYHSYASRYGTAPANSLVCEAAE